MNKLLTRDDFRESVFKRDGHKCVICKAPGVDAHHIK
jgi:5-methylcytosine-specific restriction endonuclease McrA